MAVGGAAAWHATATLIQFADCWFIVVRFRKKEKQVCASAALCWCGTWALDFRVRMCLFVCFSCLNVHFHTKHHTFLFSDQGRFLWNFWTNEVMHHPILMVVQSGCPAFCVSQCSLTNESQMINNNLKVSPISRTSWVAAAVSSQMRCNIPINASNCPTNVLKHVQNRPRCSFNSAARRWNSSSLSVLYRRRWSQNLQSVLSNLCCSRCKLFRSQTFCIFVSFFRYTSTV